MTFLMLSAMGFGAGATLGLAWHVVTRRRRAEFARWVTRWRERGQADQAEMERRVIRRMLSARRIE